MIRLSESILGSTVNYYVITLNTVSKATGAKPPIVLV